MFPRVKEVIKAYNKGGLLNVTLYFNQQGMQIDPSTWCGNIKQSIDEDHKVSVTTELELIKEKFNFYKDVSKEENSRTGTTPVNGDGNKNHKRQINREGESQES